MSEHDYEERDSRRGRPSIVEDLVLASGEFAFMQDTNKGIVKVLSGPTVFSPTGQDQPVIYDLRGRRPFTPVELEEAVQKSAIAVEGYYLTLLNPAVDGKHPEPGSEETRTPKLDVGRKVNIPGPCMFALWPGQQAKPLKGHHLRSNEYLVVRVYNEESAKENWSKAIVKKVTDSDSEGGAVTSIIGEAPKDVSLGKQYVIKGTEVSFYIPPTGVSVVVEGDKYVRKAETLERLEYAILVNEDGNKRYERGPAVVFPQPTETFIEDQKERRKFRAYELNGIQGIYIKVIADYEDTPNAEHEDGKFKAGDELFITGKDTPIYYPREEHSLIKYDGKPKHFATAIPAGEGRYLMGRMTGECPVVRGPAMCLPDPRSQIFVHRVLSDKECRWWYPGNIEALEHNRSIRPLIQSTAVTRGAITDSDIARTLKKKKQRASTKDIRDNSKSLVNSTVGMTSSSYGEATASFMPDEFSRASTYTQPRTVTLNTKYQGAPVVCPYTGYAVMVIDAEGKRRVEQGPQRLLMGYDETLEVLKLSTGQPKNTNHLLETVYLRVKNNKVSDVLIVETADHVKVNLKLSFRCDFEGNPEKWFEVENYVKFMTDHVRSVMSGAAKQCPIADLYLNAIDFVRDTVLGKKITDKARSGMFFEECGLRINDVEVLSVEILNQDIAALLISEQHAVVSQNIALEQEQRELIFTRQHHNIQREIAQEQFETAKAKDTLEMEKAASGLAVILAQLTNEVEKQDKRAEINKAQAAANDVAHKAALVQEAETRGLALTLAEREQEQKIEFLQAKAEVAVKQLEKFGPEFTSALTTLSCNETARNVSESFNVLSLLGGKNAVEVVQQALSAAPGIQKWLQQRDVQSDVAALTTEKAMVLRK